MKGNGFNVVLNAKSLVEHERRLKRSYGGGIKIDFDHPTMRDAFLVGLIPVPASDRTEKLRDTPFKLVRCQCDDDGTLIKTEDKGVLKQEANSATLLPNEAEIEAVRDMDAPWISAAVDRVVAKRKQNDVPFMAETVSEVRNKALDVAPKSNQLSEHDAIDEPLEPVRRRPPVEEPKPEPPPVVVRNRKLSQLLGAK